MRKSHSLFVITAIFMLIAVFFIAMPFIFLGLPLPFFSIDNEDVNEHEAVIEIFDSTNESIFNKMYELSPEEHISQPKPLWLLLQLSFPPGDKENYKVKVTLDNNITETRLIEFELWNTVDVKLYNHEAEMPIAIGVITV